MWFEFVRCKSAFQIFRSTISWNNRLSRKSPFDLLMRLKLVDICFWWLPKYLIVYLTGPENFVLNNCLALSNWLSISFLLYFCCLNRPGGREGGRAGWPSPNGCKDPQNPLDYKSNEQKKINDKQMTMTNDHHSWFISTLFTCNTISIIITIKPNCQSSKKKQKNKPKSIIVFYFILS